MVQSITLDVGGTLIEPFPSVGAVYAEVARDFGIECCPETLTRQFSQAWTHQKAFGYTRHEWFEVVRHSFRGLAEVTEALFDRVYMRFTEAASWRLFDDVLPTLEGLRERGVRLAVISNWDERLEPLLAKLGITRYFEHVAVSGKLGWHKPDPRIFASAAAALGVAPAEALHVGDSLREDYEGARGAGFHACRIRREGASLPGEVPQLTELFRVLESVRSREM